MLLDRADALDLLLEAEDVNERLVAKGIYGRKGGGTVPPGVLSCGELIRMNRGLRMLVWQLFPELADPQEVEKIVRSAAVREAGGSMN